jgi:hypothetical protein
MSSLLGKLNVETFCLLGASVACALVAGPAVQIIPVVRAQDRTPAKLRSIETSTPDPRNPVSIAGTWVGKQEVRPQRHENGTDAAVFSAEGNWLADLSFRLRNETGRGVFHIYVSVGFPECDGRDGRIVTLPLDFRPRYGAQPLAEAGPGSGALPYAPFRLGPGAEMTVSLADYAGQIGELVGACRALSNIHRVRIFVVLVEFEDRTLRWYNRRYHVCHLDQPGAPCEKLDQDYFPGPRAPEHQ